MAKKSAVNTKTKTSNFPTIVIQYGSAYLSIIEQLKKRPKIKFDRSTVANLQKDVLATERIWYKGYISLSQKKQAEARIHTKLMAHIIRYNEKK